MPTKDAKPITISDSMEYSPYAEPLVESVFEEKRSDLSICEEIENTLNAHTTINADDIRVDVQDGEVTLLGTVPERQMKDMIGEVAEKCFGIRDVRNQIEHCP